ncbi:MAG: nuclear transport factor 2 family protein [Cellulophaga sp.]
MKHLFLFVLLVISISVNAQTEEEKAIQETIELFFEGFHQKDSLKIKSTISNGVIAQTIAKNKDGSSYVRNEIFSQFMKGIVSIPDSIHFEEKISSFTIKIDGQMANAWTPYEFWYKGAFSHCGVNSFQLFKEKENWKIIYLIDTRRKEGCHE